MNETTSPPPERWQPPFQLFMAGYGRVNTSGYYNNAARDQQRRILFKKTVSGHGTLYVDGCRHELGPGDLMVIERPGPYIYCYEGNGTDPWQFAYVSVSHSLPGKLLPPRLLEQPVCHPENAEFTGLLERLIELRARPDYHQELSHSESAYQLVMSYITMRLEPASRPPRGAMMLKKLLDERFHEPLRLSDMITATGYTHAAMTRLFHGAFGITPAAYLTALRLRHACRMLEDTAMSIKEIASVAGIGADNYFCRLFRRYLGVTPGTYRQNPPAYLGARASLETSSAADRIGRGSGNPR